MLSTSTLPNLVFQTSLVRNMNSGSISYLYMVLIASVLMLAILMDQLLLEHIVLRLSVPWVPFLSQARSKFVAISSQNVTLSILTRVLRKCVIFGCAETRVSWKRSLRIPLQFIKVLWTLFCNEVVMDHTNYCADFRSCHRNVRARGYKGTTIGYRISTADFNFFLQLTLGSLSFLRLDEFAKICRAVFKRCHCHWNLFVTRSQYCQIPSNRELDLPGIKTII
jgi:hypothetical protein